MLLIISLKKRIQEFYSGDVKEVANEKIDMVVT